MKQPVSLVFSCSEEKVNNQIYFDIASEKALSQKSDNIQYKYSGAGRDVWNILMFKVWE